VLSESWPSLERVDEGSGLRRWFDVFVISAREGRLKSDPELLQIARRATDIPVDEVLFVDDWPAHVRTAIKLGFQGVLMQRRLSKERCADLDVVRD
jgi:HAD superfamily hydrolase (TIGR01509 family)